MKKILPFLLISFLAWLPTTDAQLTITGEDVTVCDNGTVSIDISVSNFIDITAGQFAITWDPDVVQFTSATNNMPASALYNTTNAPTGELRFSWFDANPPPGYTPAGPPVGSQVMFVLNFNIVGDYSIDNFTLVNIGSIPGFNMEFASTSGIIPNGSIVINPGSVALNDPTPPTITCPPNVTVTANIGQNSATVIYPAPSVFDNCDVPANPAVSSPASGSSFNIGTTTVNSTATDDAGNASNCSFTVTVNPPPPNPNALIIAADDLAINCNVTALDIPIRVKNFDLMTSAQFAVVWDPSVIQYDTFTDFMNVMPLNAGTALYNEMNSAFGEFRFSWFDTDGVPGENLNDSTVIFTLHFDLLNDNDLPDTISIAGVPGFPVEFTDTGGMLGPGDFGFETSIVSLIPDTIPPVITCPGNQTIFANANCQTSLGLYLGMATFSDNCTATGNLILEQQPPSGTTVSDTVNVLLIVIDEAGNRDSCTFMANFVDITLPTITCPANVSLDVDADTCFATFALPNASTADNCGIASVSENGPNNNEYPIGVTTVTFVAIDLSGNQASCQTTVTVADTIAPTIICPADIVQSNDAGNCSAIVTWADPIVDDNCTSYTVTYTPPSGTEFPVGDSIVVCVVEDQSGFKDTCEFLVRVIDDEDPGLQCPADTTILVPAGTLDTVINDIYLFSIGDNCTNPVDTSYYHFTGATTGGGNGIDASGTAFPIGTTTVTYFGEDDASNLGSCSFEVTIEEDSILTLICAPAQTGSNNDDECFNNFSGVVATALPTSLLAESSYIISGATVGFGAGLDASGSFNVGVSTVTFTVVSTSQDTLTCDIAITVADTTAPIFTNCPLGPLTLGNTIDECGLLFAGNIVPLASDNCPGISITYGAPLGSILPLGANTISAIATDAAGNAKSCSFNITVIDNQPPKILNCQNGSTITVNNDPNQCGAIVTLPNITSDDNCGTVLSFTVTPLASGDFFPVGNTPVTFTAVDDKGNTAQCMINVTVNDVQPPVLSCPGNQQPVVTSLNQCTGIVNFPTPTAIDNCGQVTPIAITPTGPTFDVGTHTVTYNAMDGAGNQASCSFTVTVVDVTPPFIPNMPNDTVVNTVGGNCGAFISWVLPNFPLDNCGIESFGTNGGSPGDFFSVGQHTISYVAIDVNGNITVGDFTITVQDVLAPAYDCPADVTISVYGNTVSDPDGFLNSFQSVDCDNIQLFFDPVTATDACGIFSDAQVTGFSTGNDFPIGTTLMSFEATDNNGNISTCSFNINVVEPQVTPASVSQSPVCEGEAVSFSVGGLQGATYSWVNNLNQQVSAQQVYAINSVTTNQAGIYTANVTIGQCTLQSTAELNVGALPVVTIDANDILCMANNAPLVLTANNSSQAVVQAWDWVYPNNTQQSGQIQTIINPSVTDGGTYTVTATSTLGCEATASETVVVSPGPIAPVITGTASTACEIDDQVTLFGQLYPGNVSYHWYAIPSVGSGLQAVNNPITIVDPSAPGTYTYYFYAEVDGCVSDTASWVITVDPQPTIVIAVTGQTQCVEGNTPIFITDSGTGTTNWEWMKLGGSSIPGNTPNIVLQNVNASFSGLYQLTASNNTCQSTATVNITITDAPSPAAQITADMNPLCEGGTVTLTGTDYNGNVTYIWTGDNIPANSQDMNQITVSPSGTGTYLYTFAAIVDGCQSDVFTLPVTVQVAPTLQIDVSGDITCVDGSGSVQLSTSTPGITTWEWADSNFNPIGGNNNSVTLANATSATSGTYYLTGYTAIGCLGFGQIDLTVTDAVVGLTATMTSTGCESGSLAFEASTIPNATYLWYRPSGTFFSADQNPFVLNAMDTGEGTYTVVANVNGCTATATVDVNLLDDISAEDGVVAGVVNTPQEFNMSDFLTLEQGQAYTVNIITPPLNGNVSQVLDSIYVYNPENDFWGIDNMVVEFCYVDCPTLCDIAKVNFQISFPGDQCVITTVISPNDDGVNDNFVVSCLEVEPYPLNTLLIFNQWGDKVYEAAPYQNDWMGTYEGKDLPDGTYFYIFQRDPDTAAEKGFVMIYR